MSVLVFHRGDERRANSVIYQRVWCKVAGEKIGPGDSCHCPGVWPTNKESTWPIVAQPLHLGANHTAGI